MKSYLDLVSEYAKVHKKKNRLTIICIAISVMLVTAIFGMADMSVRAQISENIRKRGNWHVIITGISKNTAEQIGNRNEVNTAGWVGVADDTSYEGKDLIVQGGEQDISEQMNLVISEGYYPSSAQEALLDMPALSQFGLSIGDSIDISFSDGLTRQYIITGTYNDFSSLKGLDAHGLFLSQDGIRAVIGDNPQEYYYIQFNKGVNINRKLSEIKAEYGLSENQVSSNMMLLGLMGQSSDSTMLQVYLTVGILFILVSMAGTFMIASSFNMSILERTQFFGLLRCLGATKKQIKRYIRLEGIQYSLKGVPLGLAAGCAILWTAIFALNALNSQYLPEMPMFQISWPGIAAGAVIGFLVVIFASRSPAKKAAKVSPQAAVTGNINQTNNLQINKASNTGLFHVDTAMGFRNAFSNKKSMLLIAGSFALSIILFLSFTVLIHFMEYALKPLKPYAPDLSIIGTEDSVSLDRSLVEEIKALPNIKNIYRRMFYDDIPSTSKQGNGMAALISYDEPQFRWAEKMLVAGSVDDVRNSNGVLVDYGYSERLNWEIGDMVTLSLTGKPKTVQVAGILSDVPFDSTDGERILICSEKTFTTLTGISDYTVIDLQINNDISEQVRTLITPEMQLFDKQQNNSEIRTGYYAMSVFVYGFLVVIALVALINILNTINASVSSRMGHYGVMRAVGMSGKQLKKVIRAEATAYAITGSIAGSFSGLLLHRFFFEMLITSNWGQPWKPPLNILLVTIAAAILTTFIAVISPAKKIERTRIINVINAE